MNDICIIPDTFSDTRMIHINYLIISYMEHYPTLRIVYDRRKTSSSIKESSVEIEISFEGKRKWISTGVRVKKSNWRNDKKVVGRSDALDANMKIENLENGIQNFIRKLMVTKRPFTWSVLDSFLDNRKNTNSFIEFVCKRVENRNDIQNSTRRNHRKLYTALKEFGKISNFEDLTKQNIIEYDNWLHHRKDYTQSTIASYHKYMKIYVNEAVRLEYINLNPYDGFKVKQGKPKLRKYLTIDELYSIENKDMPVTTQLSERIC